MDRNQNPHLPDDRGNTVLLPFEAGRIEGAGVSVESLSWSVGGAQILKDVSLRVGRGECLAIIGPNGAGKSTLLNMIAGELTPTTGSVLLDDKDITKLTVRKRATEGIGRTFQTSSLFGALTAHENVRFALQSAEGRALSPFLKADSASLTAKAEDLLEQVGMSGRAHWVVGDMSHGDKRKLELAVAMARKPKVLLLDEPMAGVSMEDVPDLVELIRRLNNSGVSICMVEHHMHVVLDLAHRIAVLHHGELLIAGTADEVTSDATVRSAYLGNAL